MVKENGKIGLRWLALLAIGAVMGANLIQPAVAHFGNNFAHLKKHFQQRCKRGAVLAYAFVDGNGGTVTPGFSTSGVRNTFNCRGGAIQARQFSTGSFGLRIPGVTTNDPTTGVYLFQSADDHADGIVNIDTHSGDDYIEVDTFDAASGAADNTDFYIVAFRR